MGNFARVNKKTPCKICGKFDWCLRTRDGAVAICMRVADGSVKRIHCGAAGDGYLHRTGPASSSWRPSRVLTHTVATADVADPRFGEFMESWRADTRPEALTDVAARLGVSADSLGRLGAAIVNSDQIRETGNPCIYDVGILAFSMRDAAGDVVGIRLRSRNGRKWAIRGSRNGLFTPVTPPPSGRILVCEGPTDTAALLTLGYQAIGRPSCSGGRALIVDFVRRHRVRDVAIVADGDDPGRRGAADLATAIVAYVRAVRIINPPAGIKDARAWKAAGLTAADLDAAIKAAPTESINFGEKSRG